MVINANQEEVPGIVFQGLSYELDLVTAKDYARMFFKALNCDKSFRDFATRVNKVCRGIGSCSKAPMSRDLFINCEDFAKAFRKEVPRSSGSLQHEKPEEALRECPVHLLRWQHNNHRAKSCLRRRAYLPH